MPLRRRRHDRLGRARAPRSPTGEYAAVALQSPNFFGNVDVAVQARARQRGARPARVPIAVVAEALSLAALAPPASWGAQIVVGEAQSFGVALAYGGPYAGFIASTKEHMRRIPGRLAGKTRRQCRPDRVRADASGARAAHSPRTGDVEHLHEPSALRADRNDLPRADGKDGPARRGRAQPGALARTRDAPCRASTASRSSLRRRSSTSSSSTCGRDGRRVLADALRERRILGGVDLGRFYPELPTCILMTATELTTTGDIIGARRSALQGSRRCPRQRLIRRLVR